MNFEIPEEFLLRDGHESIHDALRHFQEEAGEATAEISRFYRGRKRTQVRDVMDEIADCILLSAIVQKKFGCSIVQDAINRKAQEAIRRFDESHARTGTA